MEQDWQQLLQNNIFIWITRGVISSVANSRFTLKQQLCYYVGKELEIMLDEIDNQKLRIFLKLLDEN